MLSYDTVTIWSWSPDPGVIVGVWAATWFYLRAIRRRPVERARVVSFFAGLAAIVVALLSPIEPLADDYLLSAHMVQHLLLTVTAPALMLYGLAPWMYDWFERRTLLWRAWRLLTAPVLAFVLFHLPYSLAHVPVFYDATLRILPLHMAEHGIFIGTAFIAWWPVLAPGHARGQLPPALQMIYLFVQTIPGQIVGALITLADAPIYPTYADAPRVWDLSPLVDQQIGGLIMWIGTSTLYLAALTVVFFRWAGREERAERARYAASAKPAP
jgi:cytochrome c oxidase assembly factor CtaG